MTEYHSNPKFQEFFQVLHCAEVVDSQYSESETFQTRLKISEEDLERCHQAAKDIASEGRLKNAADAMLFLATVVPDNSLYWVELGLLEQQLSRYHWALEALGRAVICDINNAEAHIAASECYLAIEDYDSAWRSLSLAIKCEIGSEQKAKLKEQVTMLKNCIAEKKKAKRS